MRHERTPCLIHLRQENYMLWTKITVDYYLTIIKRITKMGRIDKKKYLKTWLEKINMDSTIVTRKYLSSKELYDIYFHTSEDHSNLINNETSFDRLLNSVATNELCKILKRRHTRTGSKNVTEFILVHKNETHLSFNDIKIHNTRKRSNKQLDQQDTINTKKSKYTSKHTASLCTDMVNTSSNISPPHVLPSPVLPSYDVLLTHKQSTQNANYPELSTQNANYPELSNQSANYPVYVPIPVPVPVQVPIPGIVHVPIPFVLKTEDVSIQALHYIIKRFTLYSSHQNIFEPITASLK